MSRTALQTVGIFLLFAHAASVARDSETASTTPTTTTVPPCHGLPLACDHDGVFDVVGVTKGSCLQRALRQVCKLFATTVLHVWVDAGCEGLGGVFGHRCSMLFVACIHSPAISQECPSNSTPREIVRNICRSGFLIGSRDPEDMT